MQSYDTTLALSADEQLTIKAEEAADECFDIVEALEHAAVDEDSVEEELSDDDDSKTHQLPADPRASVEATRKAIRCKHPAIQAALDRFFDECALTSARKTCIRLLDGARSFGGEQERDDFRFMEKRFNDVQDGSLDARLLVHSSGSYASQAIGMLNYPTFATKRPYEGATEDLSNCCIRVLSKLFGSLDGVQFLDAVPYRMQRSNDQDQPWKRLPPSVQKMFTTHTREL